MFIGVFNALVTLLTQMKGSKHRNTSVLRNSNVKVEFMAELMFWITFDCTGVPNKVVNECICCS